MFEPCMHRRRKDKVRGSELFDAAKTLEFRSVDELHFTVVGIIKDIDRLKLLYELFAETLDQLCRMGAAYEKDPEVTL